MCYFAALRMAHYVKGCKKVFNIPGFRIQAYRADIILALCCYGRIDFHYL